MSSLPELQLPGTKLLHVVEGWLREGEWLVCACTHEMRWLGQGGVCVWWRAGCARMSGWFAPQRQAACRCPLSPPPPLPRPLTPPHPPPPTPPPPPPPSWLLRAEKRERRARQAADAAAGPPPPRRVMQPSPLMPSKHLAFFR